MTVPTKEQIREARENAGLNQTAAAELVHAKLRTWQHWEAGDRRMRASDWELFISKVRGKEHG